MADLDIFKPVKAIISFLLLFLASQRSYCCVWITGTKYNTESVSTSTIFPANRLIRSEQTDLRLQGAKMEGKLRGSTNFNDRSDYSVALMYLGRYREAVELLENLEKEQPGQYFVAANLGTALELSGDNKDALKWINEGIHRNPDSHDGTEWLHAKILEVKIAAEQDRADLTKQSVFGLRPESIGEQVTVGGHAMPARELAEAIQYQLKERMQFVKPKDPIVAGLLFDYAAIDAATDTLESAEKLLRLAAEYGYPTEQIQPLITLYDQKIARRKTRQDIMYSVIGVAAVALLTFLYKRGIFVISRKDLKNRPDA